MKFLHLSIIVAGILLGLTFYHSPSAGAHLIPGFSIQPDLNYSDPVTHRLYTNESRPHIVLSRDSEFTLPMIIKSEGNGSTMTAYWLHVTNGNDFTAEIMPPGISIHVLPNYSLVPDGADQKFNIVIKVGKNTSSGVYEPNLVVSWKNNVTESRDIFPIPFQVGNWNWNSLPRQVESGISVKNVACKSDLLIVIIKSEDGSAACVKSGTAQKLVERGWAKPTAYDNSDSLKFNLTTNATTITSGQAIHVDMTTSNLLSKSILIPNKPNSLLNVSSLGPCYSGPFRLEILEGYFGENNFTHGNKLSLYQPGGYYCPAQLSVLGYKFEPMSSNATTQCDTFSYCGSLIPMQYRQSFSGSWDDGHFHKFTSGLYTIIAGDEWGNRSIKHFTVLNSTR